MATNYGEKLKSPKWQKKRLEVFKRDRFRCVLCKNDSEELHVHHLSYSSGKEPWDYELDNFQTLCKTCHISAEYMKKNGMKADSCLVSKNLNSVRVVFDNNHKNIAFVIYMDDGVASFGAVVSEKMCVSIIAHMKKIRKKEAAV